MRYAPLICLVTLIFLSGCASDIPAHRITTAERFKLMADYEGFMARGLVDSFEVGNPYKKVKEKLIKNGKHCLNKNFTYIEKYGGGLTIGSKTEYLHFYRVLINDSPKALEMTLRDGAVPVKTPDAEPDIWDVTLVIRAEPIGKKKTKVTIYRYKASKPYSEVVRHWSNGKAVCPDLNEIKIW